MKIPFKSQRGSVLVISLLIITVLTLLCATSLYITSQNTSSGVQVANWQQALSAAESAVDWAVVALNKESSGDTSAWNGWWTATGQMPAAKPTGGTQPAVAPKDNIHYNYVYPADVVTSQGEGNNRISSWVMLDTGGTGLKLDSSLTGLDGSALNQFYRIRATGIAYAPKLTRVSNNKLDNDLRNTMGLLFDRKQGGAVNAPQITRTIEVIMAATSHSVWNYAILMRNSINMSGGGTIDSFDSSDPSKSTNKLFDPTKRQNHAEVATTNSTNSDLRSTYVYGDLSYSGPAVKNTQHVTGTISTPFSATIPDTVDPNTPTWWQSPQPDGTNKGDSLSQATTYFQAVGGVPVNYTAYTGGGNPPATTPAKTFTASGGSASAPTQLKVNGDFTVPGGNTFTIANGDPGKDAYITIWVTGKFTTSGSGVVSQDDKVHVTWVVDGDITVSGSSYNNQSNVAANTSFIGVGSGKLTDSGSGNFIGTVNAPGYDITISGTGSFSGAVIGNSLNISGGASLHYGAALGKGGGSLLGNYAFASWFEDNSDPQRGIIY